MITLNTNSLHYKVVYLVVEMLDKLKSGIKSNKHAVVDGFISIELLNQEVSEYIDIEITSSNIEIRGDGFEMLFFFDNELFKSNYSELLTSFFTGQYKIISYLGKGDKKEAFGIVWDKENLGCFNIEKEKVNFFRSPIEKQITKSGTSLID